MGFEQLAALKAQLASRAAASPIASTARPSGAPSTERAEDACHAAAAAQTLGSADGHAKAIRGVAPRGATTPDPALGAAIGRLQKHFPLAFPRHPAPKVALKVGILADLQAHAPALGLTEPVLRAALGAWCQGQRYWASLQAGVARVDLAGVPTAQVSESEAKWARQQGGRARRETRRASPATPPCNTTTP